MKYSPKYKLKAAKHELSERNDENFSLKQQIATLTEQNMSLKRKLQLSSSNLSLISEELQLKSTLSNEELQNLSQNNQVLHSFLVDLQRKMFALSQECHRQRQEKDALIQENSRLFYENSANLNEKSRFQEKFLKKKQEIAGFSKENQENLKEIERLRQENAEIKEKVRVLSEENRNYEDKMYSLQANFQRKDEDFHKDQRTLEKSFTNLQRNYEKLFEEFSAIERLREGFVKENSQKTEEIQRLGAEISRISSENREILQENSRISQENALFRQDLKALVLAMSSDNENLLSFVDLKSNSQEIALFKGLACEFLRGKRDNLKKEKKFMKNQSSLLQDLRNLQEKLAESPVKSAVSQRNDRFFSSSREKPGDFLENRTEIPEKLKISNNFAGKSQEIHANSLSFASFPAKTHEMIMIIGSLLQILDVINVKFQWKTRFKEITRFSMDYFLRIHGLIKQTSEELANSQHKTPRKGQKHVLFKQKALKKLRKTAFVVVFAQILLRIIEKKRFFQGDPGFFQPKFGNFPENHVIHLAKNHFLLNNPLLNEISSVFSQNFASFQQLLNEILAIDCPFGQIKGNHALLHIDSSVIDVDNCNFLRIVREIEGFGGKTKGILSEKTHKELESRIKSLNSEKKTLQRKLDERSKKLEDAEKKCKNKEKERKLTLTSSKKDVNVSNF